MNTIHVDLQADQTDYQVNLETDSLDLQQDLALGIAVETRAGEHYHGPIDITPSDQEQILATADLFMDTDIRVAPIPSNYGLITWNGATLIVS